MPIDVSLTPLEDIAALEGEWRELEARADIDFYMSWGWIGTLLRQSKLKPVILRATDNGKLVGLGFLCANRETRHRWLSLRKLYLNETGEREIDILCIEHNGFLCDRTYGTELPARCIEHVLSSEEARRLTAGAGGSRPRIPLASVAPLP